MRRRANKGTLSIDFHKCLQMDFGQSKNSCFLTSYKKLRVNCNSLLCSRALVEGKRKRGLSFQLSRDLKLLSFYCCMLSSRSWLGGNPVPKQVGTSA